MIREHSVTLRPGFVAFDGVEITELSPLKLTAIYKSLGVEYPKFYKMDLLARLGFLAAEMLMKGGTRREEREVNGGDYNESDGGVILFGRSGSLWTDRNYTGTIRDISAYYPSPAAFVYTLSNIVTGEIAIRHRLHGESSSYILDCRDEELEEMMAAKALERGCGFVLAGWCDCEDADKYEVMMNLYK